MDQQMDETIEYKEFLTQSHITRKALGIIITEMQFCLLIISKGDLSHR